MARNRRFVPLIDRYSYPPLETLFAKGKETVAGK
jgi:hypothetical protein